MSSVSQIKELMDMISHSDFQFVNIQSETFQLVVSRRQVPDYPLQDNDVVKTAQTQISNDIIVEPIAMTQSQEVEAKEAVIEETTAIVSPLVGIAYVAPTPDSEPFVKVGDFVKKGQVVCIVEAMKIMNEIKSDCDGIVADIMIKNESVVEFAQPLIRIKENK